MSNNWFRVSRELFSSDLWLDEKFTRGQAWIDLIGLANFKDGFIRVRGNRIDIKRGQVGWSIEKLYPRWGWSRGKINRWFSELENDNQIVQQKNRLSSVITIVNYERYQSHSTTECTTDSTTDGRQTDDRRLTNKNDKKVKNDKKEDIPQNAHSLFTWIEENCPDVQGMDSPLDDKQVEKLLYDYPEKVIKDKLQWLGNTPKYIKGKDRKKSTNLTVRNWLKADGHKDRSGLEKLSIHALRHLETKIKPEQAAMLNKIIQEKDE